MRIGALIAGATRRVCYALLRRTSAEVFAYTDLFVSPYNARIDWKSGLGECVHLLYGWVRATKPAVVVEIGSARGMSACAMALACRQNHSGRVYSIDPHSVNDWNDDGTGGNTYEFFVDRLQRYKLTEWCEVIRATSDQAAIKWDRPIDLLFIDGDHTYEGVKRDFDLFLKWVRPTGIVAFHDTLWGYYPNGRPGMGVPRFLDELRDRGFHSVTANAFPGFTFLYPMAGGFPYIAPAPVASSGP